MHEKEKKVCFKLLETKKMKKKIRAKLMAFVFWPLIFEAKFLEYF